MGIKLKLNDNVRDNYSFVDLDAPLFLDLAQPSGESPRLTQSIINGVTGGTLIDVDSVIDIEDPMLINKPSNLALAATLIP